jgi:hypothetical protein
LSAALNRAADRPFLALNNLGASIVPLNPDHRCAEIRHALRLARMDIVVVQPSGHLAVAQAVQTDETLQHLPNILAPDFNQARSKHQGQPGTVAICSNVKSPSSSPRAMVNLHAEKELGLPRDRTNLYGADTRAAQTRVSTDCGIGPTDDGPP